MEKLTVLVVDDDREIVESIAIFLQADGYLVRKAYQRSGGARYRHDRERTPYHP